MGTLTEKCSIITYSGLQGAGTFTLKSKRSMMGDKSHTLLLHHVDFKKPVRSRQIVKIMLLDGRELKIDNVSWIPLTFIKEHNTLGQYYASFSFTRNFGIK